MSDEKPENKPDAKDPDNAAAQGLPLTIHAQYVRDISFENPGAPDSLRASQDAPEMDVNIGMDARKLEDDDLENLFEVILNIRAEAKRGDEVVFLAEVLYGIVVSIAKEVPEDNFHPMLLIEVPRLAFPFVRKLVGDLTTEGGFPPLLLNPVDFQALYIQRFTKKDGEEGDETTESAEIKDKKDA